MGIAAIPEEPCLLVAACCGEGATVRASFEDPGGFVSTRL